MFVHPSIVAIAVAFASFGSASDVYLRELAAKKAAPAPAPIKSTKDKPLPPNNGCGQYKYNGKIDICRVDTDDLGKFKTITASVASLYPNSCHSNEKNFVKLFGPCNDWCYYLCDDGDFCTIEVNDCEENGCIDPSLRPKLDCSDVHSCTMDSCDSNLGCVHSRDPSLCSGDEMCAIQTGDCIRVDNEGYHITPPNHAWGHHGNCEGWNDCGDASTCALKACHALGFETLVSHGVDKPCTEFDMCHLFYSILEGSECNPEIDWGNWCEVRGVTDIVCADPGGPCDL